MAVVLSLTGEPVSTESFDHWAIEVVANDDERLEVIWVEPGTQLREQVGLDADVYRLLASVQRCDARCDRQFTETETACDVKIDLSSTSAVEYELVRSDDAGCEFVLLRPSGHP